MTSLLNSWVFSVGLATIISRIYKSTERDINEDSKHIFIPDDKHKQETYDLESALSVIFITVASISVSVDYMGQ